MIKIVIYTDENVNVAVVEGLKRRGIEAYSYNDSGKRGASDEEQLDFARTNIMKFVINRTICCECQNLRSEHVEITISIMFRTQSIIHFSIEF